MKNITLVIGLILSGLSITLNVVSLQQTNMTMASHMSTLGFIMALYGIALLCFSGRK